MENNLRESPEAKSSEDLHHLPQAGAGGGGLHMQLALTVPQFLHALSALVTLSDLWLSSK